jgi:cobalt-zinc-cadmium efflux system outer membrane protein
LIVKDFANPLFVRIFPMNVFSLRGLARSALLSWIACGFGSITLVHAADIDLATAIKRTLQHNPELQTFVFQQRRLEGSKFSADLRPPLEVGVEVENFGGSDNFRSFAAAETTVAISSVIELGSQRHNRVAAINAREQKLAIEQQLAALALVAETTHRYINVLAAQAEQGLAAEAQTLAQSTLDAVQRRVREGASPRADALRAQAALAQTQLARIDANSKTATTSKQLMLMWALDGTDFERATGDLLQLTSPLPHSAFAEKLQANPQVQLLAEDIRLRQTELRLTESNNNTDLNWKVGIKQFQQENASALVAGISVPLFSAGRNRGDVQIAEANLNEAQVLQLSGLNVLQTQLLNLATEYEAHFQKASILRSDVLPALEQAVTDADSAYQRGLYSYLEMVAARQDLIQAQHTLIDTAAQALHLQANIEQLTAEPLSLFTYPATAPEVSQ